jgi:hypothetical protein
MILAIRWVVMARYYGFVFRLSKPFGIEPKRSAKIMNHDTDCCVGPRRARFGRIEDYVWILFLIFIAIPRATEAQSEVWTFRTNFMNDTWNTPILPYLATIPAGQTVSPENIRAQVKQSDLTAWRSQFVGDRLTKRQVFQRIGSATDVDKSRKLLLPDNNDVEVAVFQAASSYFDKLGLLGIMQIVTTWQCRADEPCPQKIMQHLDSLLAVGGKFVKTEVFKDVDGKPWIFATVTYEVPVGQELRVVPLRSRKLQVQQMP